MRRGKQLSWAGRGGEPSASLPISSGVSVGPAVTAAADQKVIVLAAPKSKHSNQLERAASQQEGWRVCRVTTGDAAMRMLRSPCDLLVLSANLPILSAFELCGIVRARPETADLPLVVVEFAGINDIRAAQAFECGADDYIDSALGLPALLSRIRSALLRRTAGLFAPEALREYKGPHLVAKFDDVFVSVDGKPIMLQRLEFCVLRYLVQRRNQLVSREALHRDVWRGRGTLTGRTIDAHVCRLRRKLGVAGKHIQTLVSLGYRFVDELDQT